MKISMEKLGSKARSAVNGGLSVIEHLKKTGDKIRIAQIEQLIRSRVGAQSENSTVNRLYKAERAETARLREIIIKAGDIADDAPEINMSNYSEDDISALNQAMIEIWTLLNPKQGE